MKLTTNISGMVNHEELMNEIRVESYAAGYHDAMGVAYDRFIEKAETFLRERVGFSGATIVEFKKFMLNNK